MNGENENKGPSITRGTKQADVLGASKGHKAGDARPQARPLNGIQIPSACSRSPWLSRFGVSKAAKGHFYSWLLLASARLRHGQSHAQITDRILAGEIAGKQEKGRPKLSSTQSGGMVCSRCLGVPDGDNQNGSSPLSDSPFCRWTGVTSGIKSTRSISREDG